VTTEAGERCVESSPASLWVMFRFVEGHHYRYNSRLQLLRAARCLSGIHAAGASFATKPVQDDTIPDLLRWWTHGEEEIVALRRMFSGGGVEPELDFLDDWRSAATRDLPLRVVAGLPRSWLHSDFRPSNVFFAGDQVQQCWTLMWFTADSALKTSLMPRFASAGRAARAQSSTPKRPRSSSKCSI